MAAGILACGLFWYVLTRFRSGEINAIDFTVYFDRPCFQTVMGRPLFVEVSDTPGFSYRSEFADHAYWAMLPICSVYAISPSPLWLHAISALAITAGAFHLLRVMQFLGAGGLLAAGAALAFVLNDNTARALNYGFHPEVLYAWLVPWMLDAGLRGARRSFALAMILCLLVKEDALLPIFAVSMTLGLHRARAMTWAERRLFLIAPPALAFASVIAYYNYVVPMLTGASGPSYAHFWANWGDTPALAAAGMLSDPGRVVRGPASGGQRGSRPGACGRRDGPGRHPRGKLASWLFASPLEGGDRRGFGVARRLPARKNGARAKRSLPPRRIRRALQAAHAGNSRRPGERRCPPDSRPAGGRLPVQEIGSGGDRPPVGIERQQKRHRDNHGVTHHGCAHRTQSAFHR